MISKVLLLNRFVLIGPMGEASPPNMGSIKMFFPLSLIKAQECPYQMNFGSSPFVYFSLLNGIISSGDLGTSFLLAPNCSFISPGRVASEISIEDSGELANFLPSQASAFSSLCFSS